MLSFLADNNVNTKVEVLMTSKMNYLPLIVHYFFDLMVTMGVLCFVISGALF